MSTYNYYTENFEGSICQDGSLNIKHITAGALEEDSRKILNLSDFLKTAKLATHAQQLLQHVLTHFSWSFERSKNHRQELATILRYFIFADHYKLLVPQDVADKKLTALRMDYDNIKEKYPDHCEATNALNLEAQRLHMRPPLVGSTGTLLYDTVEYTWIAQESSILNIDAPEYLYTLLEQPKDGSFSKVITATQNKCIEKIMDLQKDYYGFNLDEVVVKNNENAKLYKTLQELELILKIPDPETYGYAERKKQEEIEALEQRAETEMQLANIRKGLVDKLVVP